MIDNISEDFFKKNEIIKKLWPLPIVFFLVYTPVSFFILKDYFTGWIHLVTLLFFIISLLVYRKIKNVKIINNMLAIIGIPALIPWLITGGPGGVGFWWSLVYITWAFYITTKKSAILLLSTYLVLSIIIVILSQMQIGKIAYTIAELLNLLFAYIITFSLVYLFDNVREYYFQLSNKKSVELAKVNENLTSINTELEQFIYSASHDLQEPLRMVTIYLQLLEKRYKDKLDIDAKEFFEFAMDGSKRMRDLINALIDYSHINTVRTLEDIDLNKLLKNILAELKDQIVENNAIITINPLPSICADKVLISQLFQNLI